MKLRRSWQTLTSLLMLLLEPAFCDLTVEIADYWGDVTVKADGPPISITCRAIDASASGSFLWKLGDEPISPIEEKVEVSDNEFEQTFEFEPKIANDGQSLTCSYVSRENDEDVIGEDSIDIIVQHEKIPAKKNSGVYNFGDPVDLTVDFELYPEPDPSLISWRITSQDGQELYNIPLGSTDGPYIAEELVTLDLHKYRASLSLESTDPQEPLKTHELVLLVNDAEKRVPVTFQYDPETLPTTSNPTTTTTAAIPEDHGDDLSEEKEQQALGNTDQDSGKRPSYSTTTDASEEGTKEPEGTKMGIGVFIIIAIVVLILLICIGYCVYQRCCRKKSTPPTQPRTVQNQYSGVPQNEPQSFQNA